MNILKKSLAMFLVLCLMFSAVPVTAFADEPDSTNPTVTETTEETTVPETTVSETTVPETTVPETTVPETTVPETTVPETTVPETTVPETTVPETTVPETTVPETTVPETTVPETTVPETTVPETTVPETTAPQLNTPLTSPNPYGTSTSGLEDDIAPTAITMGTKPANGTTEGEPFPKGTGGSNSFRIPALVTLDNGNLLAAADARWNTTYDGGGLDTIVSISTDGGMNWSYQFANYLGDNGNEYNGTGSTTFIDPALATIGNTVYMLVDIYPYGIALNGKNNTAPVTGTGFHSNGKLLLSNDNHSTYNYYLDGDTIYDSNGNAVSGYTVDEYFNITSTDGSTNSNLFFSDSPFKVVRTGFLYLTKSTNGGKTWSAPELLNLKTSSEQVCLVGPGRGLVTSKGKVIFPVYSYNGSESTQKLSFISYDHSNGGTWSRSASMTGASWSSESAVVELTGGTLRFFYRNGTANLCYVDYNNGWGTPVVMNGSNGTEIIATNSNCQISAITYSKTVDGKQLILVSCPTGPNETGSSSSTGGAYSSGGQRLNGKIFAFTVEADGSLKKAGAISVTSNNAQFMYSCLTELRDGTVGILYEDHQSEWGTGSNCYYTMSYVEYDLAASMNLTFDGAATDTNTDITVADEGITVESVTEVSEIAGLTNFVAYNVTLTKDGANYKDAATITIPLNGFGADVELWGFVLETDGTVTYVKDAFRDYEKDTLTFLAPHFSIVGGTPAVIDAGDNTGLPSQYSGTVSSGTISGESYWQLVTNGVNGITSGNKYLIASGNSGNVRLLSRTGGTSNSVSVSNSQITSADTDYQFTLEGSGSGWTIKDSNGTYLYPDYSNYTRVFATGQATGQAVTINGTNSVTILRVVDSDWGELNCYIRFASSTFSIYRSSSNLYLFEEVSVAGSTYYTVGLSGINALIAAVPTTQGDYTDETWATFQTALSAANAAVTGTAASYDTSANANTQQTVVNSAALELYNAWQALEEYADVEITVNFVADSNTVATKEMTVKSNATTATLPTTIIGTDGNTYKVNNTNLTLKDGVTTYNVAVTLVEGTEISIEENETRELEVSLSAGQYVVWTTADSTKVAVAGEYDTAGKATGNGIILGHHETAANSPVQVIGTVHNADGSVAGTYKWLVTVTEGTDNLKNTSKYIYINIVRIQNTTVYYNINGGELIEITDDMLDGPYTDANGTYYKLKVPLMDEQYNQGFQISFFAAPDEGYALTSMASTNSKHEYYTLSDGNPDGVGSDAWPFKEGYNYDAFDSLTTKPAGGDTSVFNTAKGVRWGLVEGNFTVAQMKMMFANAISKGCDGVLVFTKNNNGTANGSTANYGDNDLVTDLSFISTPMPTIDKTVDGVLPASRKQANYRKYTEGMVAAVGEQVYFKITITLDRPTVWVKDADGNDTNIGAITYTDAIVSDTVLDGAFFYTKELDNLDGKWDGVIESESNRLQTNDITAQLNAAWAADETQRVIELYLLYEIQEKDIPKFIIDNVANIGFDYSSRYSNGVQNGRAEATASITVVGRAMDNIVIDFGQKVEISGLTDEYLKGVYFGENTKYKADYGTVEITKTTVEGANSYTVTYTPTAILHQPDVVWLYGTGENVQGQTVEKIINGFIVYPATTVYYEEGFIFNNKTTGTWNLENIKMATRTQTLEYLGKTQTKDDASGGTELVKDKKNPYGYDPIYATDKTGSAGSYASSQTIGSKAIFTFTGNGIQVFANSTTSSGCVSVEVRNSKGKVVRVTMVDTIADPGTTGATSGQTGNLYTLPIISLVDLQNIPHDTYTVTLNKIMDTEPVLIDGIRVFNTVKDSSIFALDLEDNPEFYELRDYVLNAISISDSTSQDYGNLNALATQVYNGISSDGEAPEAVITDNNIEKIYGNGATAQDLLDNGPKNELYLYKGQTLTFNVTTARTMQIGLKAPKGTTTATILVNGTPLTENGTVIETSVDMFYDLVKDPAGTDTKYTISITNDGADGSILSVTLLKVCDDPSFAFKALSAEDIKDVLMNVYNLKDAEIPTEPEVTEPEVPAETTKPTEPEVPAETTKPTEPEVPAETTKPTEPEVPAETTKPTEPEVPAETTKPTEPEVPAETTKPTEPEVPAETTKPSKPNKPGKPSKPGKPTESTEPEETKPVETQPEVTEPETPTEPQIPAEPEAPAVEYADAVLTVKLVDYKGKELGSVKLTAYGIEGKTAVFTAEEIVQAAKTQLPKKYALVDESAVDDVQVRYGAYGKVKVQIGKVATLNITFINLLGKKQGTATVTGVQTAGGYRVISAYQIRSLAPEGRFAVWFLPTFISYGSTSRLIIPVF